MAKTGLILLGVGALGALIFLGKKARAVSALQVLPQGVKLSGKFPNNKLEFLLDVVNQHDTDLDVNAIFADVLLNDEPLGRVEQTQKIKFPPLKTSKLNLPVKISLANIPAFFKFVKAVATGKKDYKFDIKGSVNASGVDLPLAETYNLAI